MRFATPVAGVVCAGIDSDAATTRLSITQMSCGRTRAVYLLSPSSYLLISSPTLAQPCFLIPVSCFLL